MFNLLPEMIKPTTPAIMIALRLYTGALLGVEGFLPGEGIPYAAALCTPLSGLLPCTA